MHRAGPAPAWPPLPIVAPDKEEADCLGFDDLSSHDLLIQQVGWSSSCYWEQTEAAAVDLGPNFGWACLGMHIYGWLHCV
jgi:hypothetical protein